MTKETRKRKRQRVIEDDEATSKRTVDEQPESIANDNEHDATQVGTPTIDPPRESNRKQKRKKKKKKKTQKRDGEPSDTKVSNRDEDGDTPAQVQTIFRIFYTVNNIPSATPSFPFPTDEDDHCESPLYAYEHVVPILKTLCSTPNSAIYDPYYCDGGVERNLNSLGFANVYNVKKDCYSVWQEQKLPPFDILVTNPPYSGDHMERLMAFLSSSSFGRRPWLLLLPNWVHKKDYYLEATKHIRPFYIVPRKRYVYEPPQNFREAKKSDVHKKSSPFVSMWYVWGGTNAVNEKLIRQFLKSGNTHECDLARSKSALRDLRRKKR